MRPVLDTRALGRATLARQHLLDRTGRSVPDVVDDLAGLQAQTPHTWYVGLWSRIAGFRPDDAARLLESGDLVRIALMRSTLHLVTARDAHGVRPLVQPVLDRDLFVNQTHGRFARSLDVDELVEHARTVLDARPLTNRQLGAALRERWPGIPPATLVYAVRNRLPLVQVPPRALWGRSGPIAHTTLGSWLGPPPAGGPAPAVDDLVLRYLAAFGPATVADIQTWSGLTRLAEVVDRLRGRLAVFADADGRELVDLPDGPRPASDTPAPPRFLYDFDNLLLSHADRSRIVTDDFRRATHRPHGPVPRPVLVDGRTAGEWTVDAGANVRVVPCRTLDDDTVRALTDEGTRLAEFLADGTGTGTVILAPVG